MIADLIRDLDLPTDKCSQHAYGPFYDAALAPYRGRPIRLLEIGVHLGGSLRLWDAYFGGMAAIMGVDVRLRPEATSFRRAVVVDGDAYTERMAGLLGTFDIIVDDGPHTLASQVAAVRLYGPRLRPGGLLVIEDVQSPSWLAVLGGTVPPDCWCEAIDLAAETGVTDDRLFVVRRPG